MTEYIDRNALIEHIRKDPLFDLVEQYGITGVIESFPAADVQPVKHGKWKLLGEPPWYVRECSECGGKWHHWHEYELPRYCNNCGATMDGEENGRLH